MRRIADGILLVAVTGSIGWSATTAVATVQQNTRNRAIVQVHLGTNPVRLPELSTTVFPAGTGTRSQQVAIIVANDSPDGVFINTAELSDPYLTGTVDLAMPNNGYVGGGMNTAARGELTVDCAQTGDLLAQIRAGELNTTQQPTILRITVTDANKQRHSYTLTIDTTAAAIQGQVCAA